MKALIRKDNSHKWNPSISSLDNLSYGDVFLIERIKFPGVVNDKDYIYLPEEVASKLIKNIQGDVFMTYRPELDYPVKYWNAYQFKDKFPYHVNNYAKISKYITHVKEWNDIKKEDDIEKIFDKYELNKDI